MQFFVSNVHIIAMANGAMHVHIDNAKERKKNKDTVH